MHSAWIPVPAPSLICFCDPEQVLKHLFVLDFSFVRGITVGIKWDNTYILHRAVLDTYNSNYFSHLICVWVDCLVGQQWVVSEKLKCRRACGESPWTIFRVEIFPLSLSLIRLGILFVGFLGFPVSSLWWALLK